MYQHLNITNPGMHKSWRGWENVVTARLLCPVDYIAEFEADSNECVNALPLDRLLRTHPPPVPE